MPYVTTGAAGGGAGTEGDPWTLAEATANVVAGDTVYVKAGTYSTDDSGSSAVMDLDVAGGNTTWIDWIGYTTTINDFTIGDSQPVVLDASVNTLTHAILATTISGSAYNRFTGFQYTGGSGHGFNFGSGGDNMVNIGCKFDNNGGRGFQGDNNIYFIACEFTGNTTNSFDMDNSGAIVACKFHNEPTSTCTFGSQTLVYANLAYNNGNGIVFAANSSTPLFIGNTIDGDGQGSSVGMSITGSSNLMGLVLNNILFDLNTGVNFLNAGVEVVYARGYNLFYSNTNDYDVLSLDPSDVAGTSDPFTNSGTRDYSLKTGSEALDAGLDGGNI